MTKQIHVSTSQRAINAYVMYYSKFNQKVNAFIKVLTEWSLRRT